MKMTTQVYMERVVPDPSSPFGTRVEKGLVEPFGSPVVHDTGGGWRSADDFAEHRGRAAWREGDRFLFVLSTAYGITSFQTVSFEE